MKIKKFCDPFYNGNCYLLETNNKGIVIDPTVEMNRIIADKNIDIVAVFLTHGHFDHIRAIDSYLKKDDIVFYMHPKAFPKLKNPMKNCSYLINRKIISTIDLSRIYLLKDNEKITISDVEIKTLYTPGHSDCSITLEIQDILFTGDTLFKGNVGRCDLYSGNENLLLSSLEKISLLNGNYVIYPGHDEETTLDIERKENFYLRLKEDE